MTKDQHEEILHDADRRREVPVDDGTPGYGDRLARYLLDDQSSGSDNVEPLDPVDAILADVERRSREAAL